MTPTTRSEFLLGKQLPYIALGMLNFFLLCGLSVFVFGVPHKGSFLTLTLAALLYIIIATGMGLLISTFMKKPDCRHFRNGDYHVDPGDTVFRDDRSGSFAGRAWTLDRRGLPDQSFSDYRPRNVLESAGSD